MSKAPTLLHRLSNVRSGSATEVTDRARRGLMAFVGAQVDAGRASKELADGTAATGIGRVALSAMSPQGLACADGCAFCCILSGDDGGTITEAEAIALHSALSPLAGQPDGRAWHPKACPSLDPETRSCRAYDARPMICRAYVSTDVEACKSVSEGQAASGPGTLGPYHTYLAAIGLSRAALKGVKRVSTYALAKVAAAAVDGASLEDALASARHKPTELDAELKRSKRDLSRA
ncbi:YkgJ family cysteine cluster protein [Marivita sp.]|uniref:YkgJ family cysteine cluster protein n=1 Tax=Marivita sp. TaxID=2003365 RepID=UPI00261B56F8|nr:YkgJ family cysteine cluster protein [Marivita sp.]